MTKRQNNFRAAASALLLAGVCAVEGQTTTNTPPPWDLSVALGLTGTEGNSDTLLFTLTGRADKKWDANELRLGLDVAYGEQEDVKNNETLRAYAQYNRLFTDRWYAYGRVEGLHDAIADVEYRFTVGPGVGYYLIKQPQTTFSVEGGPGVVFEKQGDEKNSYFTLRIAEFFEHKFNDRVRVWESLEFLPQVDDWDNFIVNGEVGVESALSKAWALRLVLQDTYDNQPAPGRKKNDIKLIAGLGWKMIR
jgi:putative salt-induced outer membrane protein YdiY